MTQTKLTNTTELPRVIFVGDSILDNQPYVPPRQAVIDHAQKLPGWVPSLFAVDGAIISQVEAQLKCYPGKLRYGDWIVISAGGNDALMHLGEYKQAQEKSAAAAKRVVEQVCASFERDYAKMLEVVTRLQPQAQVLCLTIYNAIPGHGKPERQVIDTLDQIIHWQAGQFGADVLDLRGFMTEGSDYSKLSPIEPSETGGKKLAEQIHGTIIGNSNSLD